MAYDEKLAERIRHALEDQQDVAERQMFGGLAFVFRGRMCCGIVRTDLMVRIADVEYKRLLLDRYVRPMDFTGKPLKGFVYVSPAGFRTAASLRTWLSRGLRAAEAKSAKPVGSRRQTHAPVGDRLQRSQRRSNRARRA